MLNYEKYKEKIKHYKGLPMCYVCDKLLGIGCKGQGTCIEKNIKVFDFLFSEEEKEKEPIKLTRFEFDFFNNVDPEYKWIVRDEDGGLCLYEDKPQKGNGVWFRMEYDKFSLMYCLNHLFTFIKWEDEEPTNIQELLENCEVVEDD